MLDGFGVIGGQQCKGAALLRWQQWTGISMDTDCLSSNFD
jgi:hypothetical protein